LPFWARGAAHDYPGNVRLVTGCQRIPVLGSIARRAEVHRELLAQVSQSPSAEPSCGRRVAAKTEAQRIEPDLLYTVLTDEVRHPSIMEN